MKWLTVILIMFFSFNCWAQSLDVSLSEREPLAGDTFQLIFKITLDQNETPDISFDAGGLEILGKANQGMSLRTVYMNGKLTTTREMTYVYDLVGDRAQTYRISGIRAQTSSGSLTFQDIVVKVVKEAKEKSPFFVRAEVSKTKVYVGEAIQVNYYLYHIDNVLTTEIKKFPTLNNFTKRFYDRQSQTETVNFNGAIYRRTNFYSAVLFPDVPGNLKIDPISLNVTYVVENNSNPFGGLGFSFGGARRMARSINSDAINIEVLPLPHQTVPPHYTGLVGRHTFELSVSQSKAIVNDPIEVKLIVSGPGVLEKMEAPKIFDNPSLEEFDSKFDLEVEEMGKGRKVFSLTYLGRKALDIPARKLPLSYFDPEKGEFVTTELIVPAIKVEGTAVSSQSSSNNATADADNEPEKEPAVQQNAGPALSDKSAQPPLDLISPPFRLETIKSHFIEILLGSLTFILLTILFWYGKNLGSGPTPGSRDLVEAYQSLKTNGLNYGDLYRFLSIGLDHKYSEGLYDHVQKSKLSTEAKVYLCQILEASEKSEYLEKGKKIDIPLKSKYLEEVMKQSSSNENSPLA